ncbi:MAG: alanine racemase [Lachnospiraceae bacterium]|jgi:alanine racemase|nr:alanine racemase [Lachnospiraceae bacterium]
MLEKYERVYAKIDLDCILHNMECMKANCKEGTKLLAVIKTDGYGHGALPIAKTLEALPYLFGYATATVEEALTLRKNGIHKAILILGHTFPYSYPDLVREQIRPALFRLDSAKELSDTALRLNKKCKVHIKVDTGMTRVGIQPNDQGLSFVKEVMAMPGIEIEGIFTHFATADEADKTAAKKQLERFVNFTERIKKELGLQIPICHASNSAGILDMPEANLDMVRAGITTYGLWPSADVSQKMDLHPALELKSHIAYIKEVEAGVPISYGGTYVTEKKTIVATIPVGYGDGYPRSLSSKGYVLIHGKKAPILGRVCMDQFMVDVTDLPEAKMDDEVTLIGKDGDAKITLEELGDLSGRFNYEFACDLDKRIPRIFFKNGEIESVQE